MISSDGVEAKTYYPGTSDPDGAVPVSIRAGEEVRLNTLIVSVPRSINLHFHFPDAEGPLPKERNIHVISEESFTIASERNEAWVPHISANRHHEIVMSWRSLNDLFYGVVSLDAGNADIDMPLQIHRAARITGNLIGENAGDGRNAAESVRCKLVAGTVWPLLPGTSDCIGSKIIPDLYHLELEGMPPDAFVRSATSEGRDILEQGIRITGETDIKVVIATPGSIVDGTVKDAKGGRLSSAVVALIPDAPMRMAGPLYRSAISDIHGRFQLHGIAPGAYQLFAWQDLPDSAFRNASFMKQFEGRGLPLRFGTSTSVSTDVRAEDIR